MQKIVAIVPMRHYSERVAGKNYRELAGKPLYHHVIQTLLDVDLISQVVIDTDSDYIIQDARECFPEVLVLRRPEHLTSGDTPMNEVLIHSLTGFDADVVIQTHSTNPFLTSSTVGHALEQFLTFGDEVDSVFAVTRIQARLWSGDGQPVNHNPNILLRTQDLPPIYLENSCFYIFDPSVLIASGNRIGARPKMFEVPAGEALDIDEESDFDLAVAVAKIRGLS